MHTCASSAYAKMLRNIRNASKYYVPIVAKIMYGK